MALEAREGAELHTLSKQEAQRAVGHLSLYDVLKALQREKVVLRFRVLADVIVVEAPFKLALLASVHELRGHAPRPSRSARSHQRGFGCEY